MLMVKAYHGRKDSKLQFCDWMDIDDLAENDLLTYDIKMDAEDENCNWGAHESQQGWSHLKANSCNDLDNLKYIQLDPPIEFRDDPVEKYIDKFAGSFTSKLIKEAFMVSCKIIWSIPCSQVCHMSDSLPLQNSAVWNGVRLCWTPELLPSKHPSALSAGLSASHNSLSTISTSSPDDSDHIKSAVSHEVLTLKQMTDMYNVPFDSDTYALPVDVIQSNNGGSLSGRKTPVHRKKYYQTSVSTPDQYLFSVTSSKSKNSSQKIKLYGTNGMRNGFSKKPLFSTSKPCSMTEPIHVTVDEVRQYLKTLYSNDMAENRNFQDTLKNLKNPFKSIHNSNLQQNDQNRFNSLKIRNNYIVATKNKKAKENVNTSTRDLSKFIGNDKFRKWSTCRPSFPTNLKETLCNIFRIKKLPSPDHCLGRRAIDVHSDEVGLRLSGYEDQNPPSPITKPPFSKRALPPVPRLEDNHGEIIVTDCTPLPSPEQAPPTPLPLETKEPPVSVDFASSIEKVKDCGWYWGPISGEAAEKILSNEPDGSFIVRDSSDDYYIFSLTFKLNSIIRHVRIEHDQGNFSFGSSTRFKSHTIVDFIESAVEHSRSGRYLFFLHRRPVLGPMRVQLLHPVSRFKQVQSLQHMCRFVILKLVRRDLIQYLPLPRRILDYLSTQHYYSEELTGEDRCNSLARDPKDRMWPCDGDGFS